MGRTLVIGDIHGCLDELRALLDKAALTDDDEVIALGDVVDRGPDSAGVVRLLQSTPRARSVRGNHEQKHILSRRCRLTPSLSQSITRREMGEPLHAELCTWMAALPVFLQRPEALLTHGFFTPGVPLHAQDPAVLMGTQDGEQRLRRRARPWYEDYDHPTPIIVGHHDYRRDGQPFVYRDRVFGLDTTVYARGRLTGLLLPSFQFVSVPARADHWAAIRAQNADLRYAQTPTNALTWQKARAILAAYREHPPRSEHHRRRQQRVAAMLHAAETAAAALGAELGRLATLSAEEQRYRAARHPHRRLVERHLWVRPQTSDDIEHYFKRPAQLLCARQGRC